MLLFSGNIDRGPNREKWCDAALVYCMCQHKKWNSVEILVNWQNRVLVAMAPKTLVRRNLIEITRDPKGYFPSLSFRLYLLYSNPVQKSKWKTQL